MQLRKAILRNGEKRDSCESLQSMIAVTSCCHHDGASVRSAPGVIERSATIGDVFTFSFDVSLSLSNSPNGGSPGRRRLLIFCYSQTSSVIVIDSAGYSKRWIKDDIWYYHYSITDCLTRKGWAYDPDMIHGIIRSPFRVLLYVIIYTSVKIIKVSWRGTYTFLIWFFYLIKLLFIFLVRRLDFEHWYKTKQCKFDSIFN